MAISNIRTFRNTTDQGRKWIVGWLDDNTNLPFHDMMDPEQRRHFDTLTQAKKYRKELVVMRDGSRA